MKYGLYLPNVGNFADATQLIELAQHAEENGWDGVFLWDMITPINTEAGEAKDVLDPWIVLAGIAVATERIRFGPLVTPLARRRPQKVARETATLDRLSDGRLILGVGLGDGAAAEFAAFGEKADPLERARKLDEALEVVLALWSGEPVNHKGEEFSVDSVGFIPTPRQQPRIPIWSAGSWPRRRPARRAARLDGMFPISSSLETIDYGDHDEWVEKHRMGPGEFGELAAFIAGERPTDGAFDLVFNAKPGRPRAADVSAYEAGGVTWWLEMFLPGHGIDAAMKRAAIAPGPPRTGRDEGAAG